MKSYMQKKETVERKWYVIDAEGKSLGRVATLALHHLQLHTYVEKTNLLIHHILIVEIISLLLTQKKLI